MRNGGVSVRRSRVITTAPTPARRPATTSRSRVSPTYQACGGAMPSPSAARRIMPGCGLRIPTSSEYTCTPKKRSSPRSARIARWARPEWALETIPSGIRRAAHSASSSSMPGRWWCSETRVAIVASSSPASRARVRRTGSGRSARRKSPTISAGASSRGARRREAAFFHIERADRPARSDSATEPASRRAPSVAARATTSSASSCDQVARETVVTTTPPKSRSSAAGAGNCGTPPAAGSGTAEEARSRVRGAVVTEVLRRGGAGAARGR